jgi:polar amino acid transport system substrate-binding protein
MKKTLLIVIALALALSLLAACAAPAAPAASSAAPSSAAPASPSAPASEAPSEAVSASASASPSESAAAASDDSLKKIKDKGTFVLGFDDAFKPMGFKDESGKYVGFDIDMANEFTKKIGVKLVLQPINWDTKDLELSSGNIDAIWNGFTISDEKKQTISFGVPYMNNKQVLVVKSDSSIKTLKDLAGKVIIAQENSAAVDAINANKDLASSIKELVKVSDYVKALIELKAGTVDCVAIDEIYARYQITTEKDNLRILDEDLGKEQYGVGFRKADLALTEEWNKVYKQLKDEGIAKTISEKWFGSDVLL